MNLPVAVVKFSHNLKFYVQLLQTINLTIVRSYSAKNDFYREMAVNKLDFLFMCWYWSLQTPKKVSKNLLVGNFFTGHALFRSQEIY